jgi:F0F1-type ATP synthase assembly protein I
MGWVSQITTISLGMVLPGVGGYWLDQWLWLGTRHWFLVVGVILGFVASMLQLMQLVKSMAKRNAEEPPTQRSRKRKSS